MPRQLWAQLPDQVRAAVEQHTGPIQHVAPLADGSSNDLAALLHTRQNSVFVKGSTTQNPAAWTHRRERALNEHLPPIAPRLRWSVEEGGWILNGFDVAAGRQVEVCPGSSDLPALAGALATMSRTPAPSSRIQPATLRWADWVAPDLVEGGQLVHTDVSPKNFLIAGQAIAVVDWAAPVRGAGWIDTALMVVRLIRAGHTPAQAEHWAAQVPAWQEAPGRAVTAFADARARLSGVRAGQSSAVHLQEIADAAATWAASRS